MTAPRSGRAAIGIALLLIAFNLRAVFSSLSALLPEMMAALEVSAAAASLVTTGPVICLALFAPVAPLLAGRYGTERTVFFMLAALALGTGLRGFPTFTAILVGSLLSGAAIAVMNVLMPSLVKRYFADRPALMTGGYSMVMCVGAALSAGASAPLAGWLGSWNGALAAWALPAAAAALLWWAKADLATPSAALPQGLPGHAWLWRNPLAWRVTILMGSQSALAYSVFGWLAPILRERGMDPVGAGLVFAVAMVGQVVSSFVAPSIATRGRDQRAVTMVLIGFALAGWLGCLQGPLWSAWFWGFVQGLGQGGTFSVVMTIIILRSPDHRIAAALSGMAQGGGYLIASLGPLLVGIIRTRAGSFDGVGPMFCAFAAVALWAAWGAGRDRPLRAEPTRGS
ncbi:MAG: yycB [Enterovirga sp.]|jgi:CP family cyanate transporter-like MFS transporter|nr:yycB [Enterovirga sp.]